MPRKKAAAKTETPASNLIKAKVAGNPQIIKTRTGAKTGILSVTVEGYDKNANVFFNDPKDLKLHSFKEGDEIEVTDVSENDKGYVNCTIATPVGSVEDPQAAMEQADNAYEKAESYADKAALLMGIYDHCRATVEASDSFMDSIGHLEKEYPDIHEETVRAATASVFIEFNRKNYGIDDIVPFD